MPARVRAPLRGTPGGCERTPVATVRAPVLLLVVAALAGAGCGSDDKPGYCSDLSDLQQSVKDLGDVNVIEGGKSAVTEALGKVEDNARATVGSAKSDFPDQTKAIDDSISTLKTSAQDLANSPTAQQAAQVAGDVAGVVNSVDDFADATQSDCD
jgi:hypothetical protein